VSEREFITVKLEYDKALSELQKAENVASITGGENSIYQIISPISGYIIAKNITNNSEVRDDMAEPLFSIADLSTIWVLADVFEVDIQRIKLGQSVEIKTLSNEKHYQGKIDKVYTVLDPDTKTMKVRVSLANTHNELMPGMFVSVKVECNEAETAVVIPYNSLIFNENRNFVVVKNGNKTEIREVQELFHNNGKCYVNGLTDGETVITEGQLFLFEQLNS